MSHVIIRIPTPLRSYTQGADQVAVEAATVSEALRELEQRHQGIAGRVVDAEGRLRPFVNLYLGSRNVRTLQGLDTELRDGEMLAIIPAVAGGAAKARERRLAELKACVPEVTPAEALRHMDQGAVLVDVREPDEVAQGSPLGALRLSRGYLELRIEEAVPDFERPVLTLCGSGVRSLFAAEELQRLGYRRVASVAGGFNRWKNEGLPFEVPRRLDAHARERYSRHLLMPEVGEAGQMRLMDSRVLLVGAGGLGSPAALYLAAAGVGTLGVVDHDVVDRSNLQRQILHSDQRVGLSKVVSARQSIEALNPAVRVEAFETRLTSDNVEDILSRFELVVDGSDNFPTRYLVNDACVRLNLPCVHGSVYRFEGQVTVFWPDSPWGRGPCYRCLYPEPPPPDLAPSCAEAGVLGVLPGVIGLLQATEAVKLLLGIGQPLIGRLLHYDALPARFSEYALERDRRCRYCGERANFPGYVDYEAFCAARAA
jgi:molybdopterin/thiamine biosynthesis adenylyltransferase/rhodanese-related sulfurtransferase/molybdopterin converting factor small subunit